VVEEAAPTHSVKQTLGRPVYGIGVATMHRCSRMLRSRCKAVRGAISAMIGGASSRPAESGGRTVVKWTTYSEKSGRGIWAKA
jgi:hypothetical protein